MDILALQYLPMRAISKVVACIVISLFFLFGFSVMASGADPDTPPPVHMPNQRAMLVAGVPTTATLYLNPDQDFLYADGLSTLNVSVQVVDNQNTPVANAAVQFVVTEGSGAFQAPISVLTDSEGWAYGIYQAGSQVGTDTVYGFVAGALSYGRYLYLEAGPPSQIYLPESCDYLGSGRYPEVGGTQESITALVLDPFDRPLADIPVVFSVLGDATILTPVAYTDVEGFASTTVRTGNTSGEYYVYAHVDYLSTRMRLCPFPNEAWSILPGSSADSAIADGTTPIKIWGLLMDSYENWIVSGSFSGGSTLGNLTLFAPQDSVSGDITATLTSSQIGEAVVTLYGESWSDGSGQTTVSFVAGPPAVLEATVSQTDLQADLLSSGIISVTVQDAFNHPLAGVPVTFTTTSGRLSPSVVSSNANGVATTRFSTESAGQHSVLARTASGVVADIRISAANMHLYLPSTVRALPPPPLVQLLNGNFEAGATSWRQEPQNNIIIQCGRLKPDTPVSAGCSGLYLGWLGGIKQAIVQQLIQSVSLPEYPVKLRFRYFLESKRSDCNGDAGNYGEVIVGGVRRAIFPLCKSTQSAAWSTQVIDLSDLKGQTVDIKFRFQSRDSALSSFYVDDTVLCSDAPNKNPGVPSCRSGVVNTASDVGLVEVK